MPLGHIADLVDNMISETVMRLFRSPRSAQILQTQDIPVPSQERQLRTRRV